METETTERSKFIGGSDIAAVMGLSRWKTPLQLWAEKTGKLERELSANAEAAEIGQDLEDYLSKKFVARYKRDTGKDISLRRDSRTFTHSSLPYCVAHIDRWVVGSDAIFEAKTASAWKAKEWEGEEIPTEYVLQVNWYCGILGKKTAFICVLIGGQKIVWKELQFNQELFDKQVVAAVKFWEVNIGQDQAPIAMASDNESLVDLFPEASGPIIEVTDETQESEIDNALEHRLEIMHEINDAENEKALIDAGIKQIVGENGGIKTRKYRVTWSNITRQIANVELMKKEGIFEAYSTLSVSRTFRVYANKK